MARAAPRLDPAKARFVAHVLDLMSAFAPVVARPMFGGFGLYLDGLMFALIAQERLYFKADEQSMGDFTARGLPPFTYESAGKVASLKYFAAPDEVLDEPEQMAQWARLAHACALRARSAARAPRSRRPA